MSIAVLAEITLGEPTNAASFGLSEQRHDTGELSAPEILDRLGQAPSWLRQSGHGNRRVLAGYFWIIGIERSIVLARGLRSAHRNVSESMSIGEFPHGAIRHQDPLSSPGVGPCAVIFCAYDPRR
jgi:hypothetical protein